ARSRIRRGHLDGAFSPTPPRLTAAFRPDRALPFVARAQAVLASASVRDHGAFDLRADIVSHAGWRILHLLTRTATLSTARAPTVDQALGHAWHLKARGVDLLRSALILCADHELNVSSFTARCVASAAANPYGVVMAGLGALHRTRDRGRHELNVSSCTARCVSSAAANPYGVVMAGLAALEGTRHGGASARIESMLDSL